MIFLATTMSELPIGIGIRRASLASDVTTRVSSVLIGADGTRISESSRTVRSERVSR
jgi:hypothetical protein